MIDLTESKVVPGRPRVDSIEETIRVKRLNEIDQATHERNLAKLRTGLVSVSYLRNKEIFINIILSLIFLVLIIMIFRLINEKQYGLSIWIVFMLICYGIAIFSLHDNNIRKIALSLKNIKVEKN